MMVLRNIEPNSPIAGLFLFSVILDSDFDKLENRQDKWALYKVSRVSASEANIQKTRTSPEIPLGLEDIQKVGVFCRKDGIKPFIPSLETQPNIGGAGPQNDCAPKNFKYEDLDEKQHEMSPRRRLSLILLFNDDHRHFHKNVTANSITYQNSFTKRICSPGPTFCASQVDVAKVRLRKVLFSCEFLVCVLTTNSGTGPLLFSRFGGDPPESLFCSTLVATLRSHFLSRFNCPAVSGVLRGHAKHLIEPLVLMTFCGFVA